MFCVYAPRTNFTETAAVATTGIFRLNISTSYPRSALFSISQNLYHHCNFFGYCQLQCHHIYRVIPITKHDFFRLRLDRILLMFTIR